LNVFSLKPRESLKNRLEIVTGREHSKYMLDSKPSALNDRFATQNLWIDRNTL
jgi:hypothetical protein